MVTNGVNLVLESLKFIETPKILNSNVLRKAKL